MIRQARLEDAEAIARVHVDSWRGAYRGLLPDELLAGLSVERRRAQWEQYVDDPASRLLVAEHEGSIVGFVSVGPSRDEPDTAELYAIYLDPAHWDRGLGRALMERGVEAMRELGYREATLWVLDGNERAARFYRLAGWQREEAIKIEELGGTTLREVRYRRSL